MGLPFSRVVVISLAKQTARGGSLLHCGWHVFWLFVFRGSVNV